MRRWMKTVAMFAMAVSLCVGNSAGAWAASSDREESDAPVQLRVTQSDEVRKPTVAVDEIDVF